MTGHVGLFLVVLVLVLVVLLVPGDVLAGVALRATRRPARRARWCPFCSRTLELTTGQHVEHIAGCRRAHTVNGFLAGTFGRVLGPDVTGGRSPIRCGRHPERPGEWDSRTLPDGLPVGWFCPSCREGRRG